MRRGAETKPGICFPSLKIWDLSFYKTADFLGSLQLLASAPGLSIFRNVTLSGQVLCAVSQFLLLLKPKPKPAPALKVALLQWPVTEHYWAAHSFGAPTSKRCPHCQSLCCYPAIKVLITTWDTWCQTQAHTAKSYNKLVRSPAGQHWHLALQAENTTSVNLLTSYW